MLGLGRTRTGLGRSVWTVIQKVGRPLMLADGIVVIKGLRNSANSFLVINVIPRIKSRPISIVSTLDPAARASAPASDNGTHSKSVRYRHFFEPLFAGNRRGGIWCQAWPLHGLVAWLG